MRLLLVTSGLLAILTGCSAVGPDYSPPTIPTPETFVDRDATPINATDLASWWTELESEPLSGLVTAVLAHNHDLAAAVERVEVLRATYGVAVADRLPTLNVSGSFQRTRPFGFPATTNQWGAGSSLSWEIDLFGRVRRSVEAAAADLQAAQEDLHGVQVALVAEAVSTYLLALSLQERLGIAKRNVVAQTKSMDIADRRKQAGMTSGLDPAQARVNLYTTQASIPALQLQLRRASHRLSVLTGQNPAALLGQMPLDQDLPAVPSQWLVGVPTDLLRNRPDVRGLERRLAAQSARIGVATAALYPAINLAGSWDWLSRTPSTLFDSGTGTGGIGPLVSIPIFNAGRLRSRRSAEEAAYRELDRSLRQRVLVAQEEVENALVAIVRDRDQVNLLTQAVSAARDSVELSRQLYTSGQSNFQNVLDAQRSLFALEDELAQARLNTLLDLVDLYRALGGGWASRQNEPE